jgi:hypothetical protein
MACPAVYALPCTGHSDTINLHIKTSIPYRTEQVGSGNDLQPHTGIVIRFFRVSRGFVIGNNAIYFLSLQISQFMIISFRLPTEQTVLETDSLNNLQIS